MYRGSNSQNPSFFLLFLSFLLINHSKEEANVIMRIFVADRQPRVVFLASKEIFIGQEIQYDYGERRKDVLAANPWLK